jgi:hypothetical protein
MNNKRAYVNTVRASLVFVFFLTAGYIWACFYPEAPFTAYMEGLAIALGLITGKRLAQKWQGKTKGFKQEKPAIGEEER